MDQSIFERAKKYDIAEFIEGVTSIPIVGNKNIECPFCGRKEKFSINRRDQFFKCFHSSCDKGNGGDIITFAERYFDISKTEAAKRVLEFFGESVDLPQDPQSREEARERLEKQRKQREQEREEQNKKLEQIKKARRAELAKEKTHLLKDAKDYQGEIQKIFPQFMRQDTYGNFLQYFIGWDKNHESVCIINQVLDGETYNIKHRTKKEHSGKWLSAYDSTTHPFPLSIFNPKEDYCFLVEGEKDAINLASLNINVLTLGGVGNSWTPFKEILRDKKVIIFYDHDKAGYIGAMKRANELKDVAKEVRVVLFFDLVGVQCKNGYDVSDYIADRAFFCFDSPTRIRSEDEYNQNKEDFLQSILYASYRVNQASLVRIANHLNLNDEEREKYGIKTNTSKDDIFKAWSMNATPPKSEKDDEDAMIELMQSRLKAHKGDLRDHFSRAFGDDMVETILKTLSIKKEMLSVYRKTHRVDLEESFYQMLKDSKMPIFKDVDGFKAWDGTYFIPISEDDLKFFCRNYWFSNAKVQKKSWHDQTTTFLIKDLSNHIFNIDEKRRELPYRSYAMDNGTFLIWDDGKIRFENNFDYKRYPLVKLNFAYNSEADCPKWQKFLDKVLPDIDDQKTLQEFFGYCLMPSHHYERFLFLYGRGGANGKSVIQSVLSKFFSGRTSQIDLQNLSGHNLHGLKDKMLNTGTEIDASGASEGMQALKALTSSTDTIMINPKNRDTYTLDKKSQPKMIFSGNKKPSGGLDEGVFRRMLMLEFKTSLKEGERIFAIDERFIDEMDGIFNWSIVGLARLVSNRSFTISQTMRESVIEYKDEQNPMRVFVVDGIEGSLENSVLKEELYKHYVKWAKDKGYQPMATIRFYSAFKAECGDRGIFVKEFRCKSGKRMIKGIKLIVDIEDENIDD